MGVYENISKDRFPEQLVGTMGLGQRVKVYYQYDVSQFDMGTIVRRDMEEPGRVIIQLDNGRFILDTECQYSPVRDTRVLLDVKEGNPNPGMEDIRINHKGTVVEE